MSSLRPNLVQRIARLPKPANTADALQPLFEAISNAIHSTQARFEEDVESKGFVEVIVTTDRKKEDVSASVRDNGFGLNDENWQAFTETDTDHKIAIGGKGVGRLLWLDCFTSVFVDSVYSDGDGSELLRRSFKFRLDLTEQFTSEKFERAEGAPDSYFYVYFKGLRSNGYNDKFPGRGSFVFQHLTSHFLPTFIGKRCPQVTVNVGEDRRTYPDAINEIVLRRSDELAIRTETFGDLQLIMMECGKIASADLKGSHFVHFIAHDRTVKSQCIDAKLGLKYFGKAADRVFHALLTGEFLDNNVNQQRTKFLFDDNILDAIINDVCATHIETFLHEPISELRHEQRETIETITATYPSVAFGDAEELLKRVPTGELKGDAIYGHLSRERFRRDERQADKIRTVMKRLKDGDADYASFQSTISEAGKAIEESEQKSLAEYIVRRKVVLDFIKLLLEKIKDEGTDSSFQREEVLHSFICPMRVDTTKAIGKQVEPAASHDLWIIDERLTMARYFSSDMEFSKLAAASKSDDRPDLLIFDYIHGLRQSEEASKVMLVEFKRPGRKNYRDDENPQAQIERYVRQLKSGDLEDVAGRPIVVNDSTIFYCFIVADIVGKLADWTYTWQRTLDGRGRIYRPDSGFRGTIELMGWDELLRDATARNQAFFDSAGLSGKSFFDVA